MHETLQGLKSKPTADVIHATMNRNRDEILENAYRRGFSKDEQFDISQEYKADMLQGWSHGDMTSADAFYHYYSHFTRDQDDLEQSLEKLKTRVKVVWGERDFYIKKEMGLEFASKARVEITILPGLGHYPHLQSPAHVVDEVRAAFGGR
jgi:pimeloyl-ACP methyl ester carboxylesterase